MRWRPFILPVFLVGTLSAIYFLPHAGEVAQAAVKMELPPVKAGWSLRAIPPSQAELDVLARDTEFSKAICLRPRPGEINLQGEAIPDRIDLSIVLSGYDLNNSIHRPERCMPSQGHQILSSSDIPISLPGGQAFTIRRLISTQRIPLNEARTESLDLKCVTYYFFVGHDRITHDHLGRTFIDMKDRLVHGLDQRWAYVSASMWFGKLPWVEEEISEQEADVKLRGFITELANEQIAWDQIRSAL